MPSAHHYGRVSNNFSQPRKRGNTMHGIKTIKELNERAAKNQAPLPQPAPVSGALQSK